jgi:hypothetical protein
LGPYYRPLWKGLVWLDTQFAVILGLSDCWNIAKLVSTRHAIDKRPILIPTSRLAGLEFLAKFNINWFGSRFLGRLGEAFTTFKLV